MIIDAHAHACGEFADPGKLTEILDRLGVHRVALCPGPKGHTSAPSLPNIPISAILDRLLHYCQIIPIGGSSYRIKDKLESPKIREVEQMSEV